MSLAEAKRVEGPSEHRLGVLFEISIVCHVFVFVVIGGWLGFLLCWGLFWLSACFWFLGLGFLVLAFVLLHAVVWGGGWVLGVLGLGVFLVRLVFILALSVGGGWVCGSALVWFGGWVFAWFLLRLWGVAGLFSWFWGAGWCLVRLWGVLGVFVFRLAFFLFFGFGLVFVVLPHWGFGGCWVGLGFEIGRAHV